jgi:hypothetical protein
MRPVDFACKSAPGIIDININERIYVPASRLALT